ncbi:MAG: molybdate ABC transporter substrate-binding protein [Desulfobulbaceae bacterium]|nr:molybdate ABC transporter substrate-binding protein [Desulfobulbaceae bacterium]
MQCLAKITFMVLLTLLLAASRAPAAEAVAVAVAANFMQPLEKLAALFEAQTGIRVQYSASATGKLYAQIKNGAPYDLFLAGDSQRPELLHQARLVAEPKIYARGRVVLWTREKSLAAADWRRALTVDQGRIAMASPEIAPYGAAAAAALKRTGLWKAVEPRLVFAQSVGQAFQYGEQGATLLSFTALSYALSDQGKTGRYWPVAEAPEVVQKGCLVKDSPNSDAAGRFWKFLFTEPARKIVIGYGYR